MKKIFITASIACLFLLTGCQTPPPLNFSVPNVGKSNKRIDAEVKSMTVTLARADEVTGKMPSNMNGVAQTWQVAIIEAINKMVIFTDDAKKRLNLSVKVMSLDIPGAGFSVTTNTTAVYELMDRASGDVIYSRSISSQGAVPADFAFDFRARRIESVNRTVQNNITMFLQDLETIDINKPMFPVAKATK